MNDYASIKDLISKKISGEWGSDPSTDKCVGVIRTTNFTNDGRLNLDKLALRDISDSKVNSKKLIHGDVIIEKSGGSPAQPVGRVVYFDVNDDKTYLCNNFTAILRPTDSIFPKYLFYGLFFLHLSKRTLAYQNKTTGIINLQLDRYLTNEKLNVPSFDEQKTIVEMLDQADSLRQKRKQTISLLDKYLESKFLEMFGEPLENPKGFPIESIDVAIKEIKSGWSALGENRAANNDEFGVLKISSVTSGIFRSNENKFVANIGQKKLVTPQKGDLLFSRANTRELVAATCVVDSDYKNLFLPDKIWKINPNIKVANSWFLHYLIRNESFRDKLRARATGTSGSMLNISQQKFLSTKCYLPPLELQNNFSDIVELIQPIRAKMLMQLMELENQFQALMQNFFSR